VRKGRGRTGTLKRPEPSKNCRLPISDCGMPATAGRRTAELENDRTQEPEIAPGGSAACSRNVSELSGRLKPDCAVNIERGALDPPTSSKGLLDCQRGSDRAISEYSEMSRLRSTCNRSKLARPAPLHPQEHLRAAPMDVSFCHEP